MSTEEYSAYEAKARFSELIRKVRQGRTVTITYHGKPVAELRPVHVAAGIEERIEWLRSRGRIVGGGNVRGKLLSVARRPGALKRFLRERDEPG